VEITFATRLILLLITDSGYQCPDDQADSVNASKRIIIVDDGLEKASQPRTRLVGYAKCRNKILSDSFFSIVSRRLVLQDTKAKRRKRKDSPLGTCSWWNASMRRKEINDALIVRLAARLRLSRLALFLSLWPLSQAILFLFIDFSEFLQKNTRRLSRYLASKHRG